MKKIGFYALIISFAVFTLSSCSNVEKEIIGEWEVDKCKLENFDKIVSEYAESFDSEAEAEEFVELFSEAYEGYVFEFSEDKEFKMASSEEDPAEGEWTYNKEKELFEVEIGKYNYELAFKEIDDDIIEGTWTIVSDNDDTDFIYNLTLKRK